MTTIAQDVIERFESWEEITDAARLVAADLDTGRFTLGDIANRCARVYGEGSIGNLATEIRIASRKTLYQYAEVAKRFQPSTRGEYCALGLTYTHFRDALRAGDQAEAWLTLAADNDWPAAKLAREIAAAIGAKVGPVKLWEGAATVLNAEVGWLYLGTEGDCGLGQGQRVIVKLYAVGTDQSVEADEMAEAAE